MYYWTLDPYATMDDYLGPETSIDECLKSAHDYVKENNLENKYQFFYVGEFAPYEVSVDCEKILRDISDIAYEDYNAVWEPYIELDDEAIKELENNMSKVMNQWLAKYHYSPTFGEINNITQYKLS